jgi:hypothetical protein
VRTYLSSSWMALSAAALILLLPQMTWARPISLGSIHLEPAAEVQRFWPLARYLANQLQSEGIDQGRVVVAQSILQMAAFLREQVSPAPVEERGWRIPYGNLCTKG